MQSTHQQAKKPGFTLIELLIVVAIIAILAAIAVPNFLEAQTRSKVSRVKADMRTVAVALESYAVDHNKFPDEKLGGNGGYFPHRLTTPVAYISTIPLDVFRTFAASSGTLPAAARSFLYFRFIDNQAAANLLPNDSDLWAAQVIAPGVTSGDRWGGWVISSFGPDQINDGITGGLSKMYDSTNGTLSSGDIGRSQKQYLINSN